MKNKQLNIGFILSMVVVFLVILITVFLINEKLKHSIDEISYKSSTNWRIRSCNTIYRQLLESENLSFAYNLTEDEKYLTQFYANNYSISKRTNYLQSDNKNYQYAAIIDSFVAKVEQRKYNIEKLLRIQNKYRLNETLQEISLRTNDLKPLKQTRGESTNNEKKRFSFSKKTTPDESQKLSEAINRKNDQISVLKNELEEIKRTESAKEIENNQIELRLITTNIHLSNDLFSLINNLENKERILFAEHTKIAKKASGEIKLITTVFSFIASCFLFIALYFIYQYYKKNNEHKQLLKTAQLESERLADARAKFLATMSHEIRTPLNAIRGFSEQLHKKKIADTVAQEQIEIIHTSANYLTKIINDVLDYSKIELDQMSLHKEVFTIDTEIKEVVKILSNNFAQKNNEFQLDLHSNSRINLMGDAIKFKQILFNLLGNANKFTSNGTITLIELKNSIDKQQYIFCFQIKDTGIGMSKDFLGQIFTAYKQEINTHNKHTVGTGLGLSITKKMIDLMGGTIHVESEEGKGTTFTIELPFEIHTATENETSIQLEGLNYQSILVVDDEAYNRKLVKAICENYNCSVTEAESGIEALKLLEKSKFDLILIDMRMPEMTGLELVELLREKQLNAQLIALTASILSEDEQAKFDRVLLKPIDENKLTECLFSTETIEAPKEENSYDLSELRNFSNTDDTFMVEMLETFISSSTTGLQELNTAFAAKNREEISNAAHKLASPCKHIRAKLVYSQLKELELLANEMTEIDLHNKVTDLNRNFETLITQIKNELK